MKVFIKKIILFLLPIALVLGIIFLKRADREFCYNYIKGDCDARGKLFYKKLYTKNENVDYLFVGSSKTMNGINDGLIEDSLNHSNKKFKLYNAGYCRFGRNLDFLFIKEFARTNKLKKVFLEVRNDESTTSHPIYAYLANGKEILQGALAFNGAVFSEIYNHLLMNINYFRTQLQLESPELNTVELQLHGYNNIDAVMEKEKLENYFEMQKNDFETSPVKTGGLEYHYTKFYLNKMKSFCEKNNIELNFVYLPSFGNASGTPAFLETYKQIGKAIIGPDSIFKNELYWKDVAHFNTGGATAYSKFLAGELAQ